MACELLRPRADARWCASGVWSGPRSASGSRQVVPARPDGVLAGFGVFAHGRDPLCPASAAGHGTVDHEHDDGAQDREEPGPQVEEVAEASAEDQ